MARTKEDGNGPSRSTDEDADPAMRPGQACSALSREARIVLGCLEILAHPTVDGVAAVTGISSAEVRRCIGELHAVGGGSAA